MLLFSCFLHFPTRFLSCCRFSGVRDGKADRGYSFRGQNIGGSAVRQEPSFQAAEPVDHGTLLRSPRGVTIRGFESISRSSVVRMTADSHGMPSCKPRGC